MFYNETKMDSSHTHFSISGIPVAPGETREIYLKVSESYLSNGIQIPVTVIRGGIPVPRLLSWRRCTGMRSTALTSFDA